MRRISLLALAVAFLVSTLVSSLPVQAATDSTPTTQASTFAYMTATKWCIQNGLGDRTDGFDLIHFGHQSSGYWHDKMTVENVKAGTWWQDDYNVAPSFLLGGTGADSNLNRDVSVIIGFCRKGYSDVGTSYGRKL